MGIILKTEVSEGTCLIFR